MSGGSSVWSGVGGITTTPLGLVEFDVLRFRNSFLQVSFRLAVVHIIVNMYNVQLVLFFNPTSMCTYRQWKS